MMAAYQNTMKEVKVMGTLPEDSTQFIELDADDARHFGYLGPVGTYRFFKEAVAPHMEGPVNPDLFAEALTEEGWVECVQGVGIPPRTLALRLHPVAIGHFIDMGFYESPEAMHEVFLNDYLRHLTKP